MRQAASRLATAIVLMLGGCDWAPGVELTNASGTVVAERIRDVAAAGGFARPGRWETVTTIEAIEVPGMPAPVLAQLKANAAKPRAGATCLSAEDVQRGAFYVGEENQACRYERFRMGGGAIDGLLRCTDPSGTRSMAVTGRYAPDSYSMSASTDLVSAAAEGPGRASVKMRMQARRTGACRGDEAMPMRPGGAPQAPMGAVPMGPQTPAPEAPLRP